MSAGGIVKAVPDSVWIGLAAMAGVWWAWRQVKAPLASIGEVLGNAVEAVTDGVNQAVDAVGNSAPVEVVRDNKTLRNAVDARYGRGLVLTPKVPGHTKKGAVWYGYDKQKAAQQAQAAANSQIAKDIKKYGGGYGALIK